MRRFRFHLGTLVILVLLLAVGFAALRESNNIWDSSIFSITLGMLFISILLAVHRTEKRRAFWIGYALFGWSYLGLTLMPSIESRLITTKALAYLDSKMPGRSMVYAINSSGKLTLNGRPITSITSNGGSTGTASGTTENFVRIVHSLIALIAAILGGLLSRYLYFRNRDPATL